MKRPPEDGMRPDSGLVVIVLLAVLIAAPRLAEADFRAAKIGDSLIDARALTIQGGFGQCINGLSFQQDAIVTHGEHQYVVYYDGKRRVCLARRELPRGRWRIMRFADYDFKSNDAHNTISMGICPKDGTIHLAFDHHGHSLHYRVSRKDGAHNPTDAAWDTSLFGPVISQLEAGKPIKITYPRFWQTPDGGLQFCYRRGGSGNGDRMLVDYDAESGLWVNTRQIDSGRGLFQDSMGDSRSRCSYPNGYNYGPDGKLHATWVWRESSQGSNHDLMYAYSRDRGRTWLNNKGEPLGGPPGLNSPGITVVPIDRLHGLMNTHGHAVDSKGRVHVVMWHCTDQSLRAASSRPGEQRWGP
ncbi:MAG: BNR repeat-containing protein, partial [Planctomycetota bacterium]